MIAKLQIASIGTFGSDPVTVDDLSQLNFFFGSNGTGKTTISRVIADEEKFSSCAVTWRGGTKLQAIVYNRDFIARNFAQSAELKGIFTLGEKDVETRIKIDSARADLKRLTESIESLTRSLEGEGETAGKKGELATLESEFKDKCWAQKQKHDATFSSAFEGFRNNAENF